MRLLRLGRATAREMQLVCEAIDRLGDEVDLRIADTLAQALQVAGDDLWFPDLAVVLQNWPDEYSPNDVEALLSQLPLTRWVCCFGAWCESDGRNRDIWPLAVRVPARCAVDRIHRELGVLRGEKPALPLTAGRDEVYRFDHGERLPTDTDGGTCLVHSADRALRRSVEDLLRRRGDTVWSATDHEPPSVIVWDADSVSRPPWPELRALRAEYHETGIVAVMGLAHPEDVDDLLDAGADEVVTKLAPADVLCDAVESATTRRQSTCQRLSATG